MPLISLKMVEVHALIKLCESNNVLHADTALIKFKRCVKTVSEVVPKNVVKQDKVSMLEVFGYDSDK